MAAFRFVLVTALVALAARSQQNSPQEPSAQPQPVPPASCPITRRPAKEFTPPVPYERDENSFCLGTEKLWTFLPEGCSWLCSMLPLSFLFLLRVRRCGHFFSCGVNHLGY